jgi:hypothetical protein
MSAIVVYLIFSLVSTDTIFKSHIAGFYEGRPMYSYSFGKRKSRGAFEVLVPAC